MAPQNSVAVFEDLAADMAAGVEFLRSRPEIDWIRIGLAGVPCCPPSTASVKRLHSAPAPS